MKNAISLHSVFSVAAVLVALHAGMHVDSTAQMPLEAWAAPVQQNAGSKSAAKPEGWPREVKSGDTTFIVHQPQFEGWDGHSVGAFSAVEVKTAGSDKPVYGVVHATATANIDKVNRMVTFEDLRLPKVSFPAVPDMEGLYLRILQNSVMPKVRQISLDRFEASITVMEAEQKVEALPLKNDPPKIILSKVAAILIYIDGNPAYKPVKGIKLERVINTRPLVLKDAGENTICTCSTDGWKLPWLPVLGPSARIPRTSSRRP